MDGNKTYLKLQHIKAQRTLRPDGIGFKPNSASQFVFISKLFILYDLFNNYNNTAILCSLHFTKCFCMFFNLNFTMTHKVTRLAFIFQTRKLSLGPCPHILMC